MIVHLLSFFIPIWIRPIWERIKHQKSWGFHDLLFWALPQGPWRRWSRWFNTWGPPCVYHWSGFCSSPRFSAVDFCAVLRLHWKCPVVIDMCPNFAFAKGCWRPTRVQQAHERVSSWMSWLWQNVNVPSAWYLVFSKVFFSLLPKLYFLLSIFFSTFYLFLVDVEVTVMMKQRIFLWLVIQFSWTQVPFEHFLKLFTCC